jgi:serpin B
MFLKSTTMKLNITISILAFLTLSSCTKDNSKLQETPKMSFTLKQAKLLQSSNQFGINLFKDLTDDLPQNENLFISPLSVYLALTMAYNGAATETATEMQNTLEFEGLTKEEINQSCQELVDIILHADPKVVMEIANSIWYRNDFSVKQDFIDINKTYFDAEVKSCDFSSPATLEAINNWVKLKTHDKIEKVLNNIPGDAVMYLINAIYFKGMWKYTFDKTKTSYKPFYLNPVDTVMVPFMEQYSTLNYMENELVEAVELPYGNNGFSMVLLLPKNGKDVSDVIDNFTETNWQSWNEAMDSANIKVLMPRFKFSYDTLLNESLQTLGIKKAFTDAADFSNINDVIDILISRVLHKSFVEVNEEGTEAAAVTVIEFELTAYPGEQPKTFNANKPFIFAIKENTNHTILFAGLINKPVSK